MFRVLWMDVVGELGMGHAGGWVVVSVGTWGPVLQDSGAGLADVQSLPTALRYSSFSFVSAFMPKMEEHLLLPLSIL